MAQYLDKTGLTTLWSKIKALIPTKVSATVTGTNSAELVRGNMADNDQFRILVGGTGSNAGYAEIATADDGSEPIYVRQYTGVFTNLARTATLLDGSGNTSFPGTVTASSFSGSLNGNATSAGNAATANSAQSAVTASTAASASLISKNSTFNDSNTGRLSYYDGDITNTTNNAAWSAPSSGWHQIIHNDLSVGGYWTELSFPVNDINGLAWRQRRANNYYGWYRILDSNNFNAYAPSKTGAGASGTWDINVTGSAGSVAWSNVSGKPSSLKNPNALTMQANGTTVATYDGSSAKTVNITPSAIGAAASSHTHSYLPLSGGTVTGNLKMSNGDLYVNGGIQAEGTVNCIDDLSVATDATINNDLNVYGNATIRTNANVGGTLTASGATTLSSTLSVGGDTTLSQLCNFSKSEAHFGVNGSYTDPYDGQAAGFKFGGSIATTGAYVNGDVKARTMNATTIQAGINLVGKNIICQGGYVGFLVGTKLYKFNTSKAIELGLITT